MSEAIAAGWYPDTTGVHQFRYWDGQLWTHQVADNGVAGFAAVAEVRASALEAASAAPLTPRDAKLRARLAFILIGAGAIIVGSLMPWVSVSSGFASQDFSGTSAGGAGGFYILLAVVIVALAGLTWSRGFGRGSVMTAVVLGAATVVLVGHYFEDLDQLLDESQQGLPSGVSITPGAGLPIMFFGAWIVVVAGAMAFRWARRP